MGKPLPQIPTGTEWDVRPAPPAPGQCFTDVSGHTMRVPMGDDSLAQAVRDHEMGHARFSKTQAIPADVTKESVLACEELRITRLLAARGITSQADLKFPEDGRSAKYLSENVEIRDLLRMMVATAETGRAGGVRFAASRVWDPAVWTWKDLVSIVQLASNRLTASPGSAIEAAKILDCYGEMYERAAEAEGRRRRRSDKDGEETEGEPERGKDRVSKHEVERGLKEMQTVRYDDTAKPGRWGPMEMVRPPLPINLRGKMGRGKRSDEYGAVPRAMHRLLTDRRVFTTLRRELGGTVLVDMSGSMSLTPEQVEGILRAAPGATVAGYNGNAVRGWLTLLAEKGRITTPEHCIPRHSGNTVDGPALYWLAAQRHPRIWVSDGLVVGATAGGYPGMAKNLLMETMAIVRAGRILRLPDADSAVAYLKRKAKAKYDEVI